MGREAKTEELTSGRIDFSLSQSRKKKKEGEEWRYGCR